MEFVEKEIVKHQNQMSLSYKMLWEIADFRIFNIQSLKII